MNRNSYISHFCEVRALPAYFSDVLQTNQEYGSRSFLNGYVRVIEASVPSLTRSSYCAFYLLFLACCRFGSPGEKITI